MAVVCTLSNHYKYQKAHGYINFATDVFKIILMNTTFAFDKDAHAILSDVTANQLATNYGYTQNDKVLTVNSYTEDDTSDSCSIVLSASTWTASGGTIGPSGSAIIYDDTTSDDTIIGCIDYGVDISATTTQVIAINTINISEV